MSKKELFLNTLMGKKGDRVPVFCANQTSTFDQMEELQAFWPEAHQDANAMATLAAGAYTVLGFDAVRVPFCQTIEAEVLGCTIKDGGKKGFPSVGTHPFKINDEFTFPEDYAQSGRIPVVAEAVKLLKEKVGNDVAVLGGVVGPFSIATSLLGVMDILTTAFTDQEKVKPWLDIAERASYEYAKALIDAGADAIVIEDMMASLDMASPQIFKELAAPYQKKLIDKIPVPTILHICGKVNPVIDDMIGTGVSALSVDIGVDMDDIKEKIKKSGKTVTVVGGIDAVNTLFFGKDAEPVKAQTKEAIEKGYDIVAPSCSIPPVTPNSKLLAMVEAAREAKS